MSLAVAARPENAGLRTAGPRHSVAFEVHLDVFDGPFDLLLGLISKHQLDITEVALAQVADEFVAHVRKADALDLDQMTSFLVVAATLLDLKAARLLPSGSMSAEEDLALLEARDLLFARLLQYRAYKQVAAAMARMLRDESRWTPRVVGAPAGVDAPPRPVDLRVDLTAFAALAAEALAGRRDPEVDIGHLHLPRISIGEHVAVLTERLTALGTATFRALCSDCRQVIEVVARFLALLDMYRDATVTLHQITPLGDLQVRWIAPRGGETPSLGRADA